MSEELKLLLNSFATDTITKIQSGIETGTQFLSKELPLVAQEIISWGIYSNMFLGIVCGVLFILFTAVSIFVLRYIAKEGDEEGEIWALAIISAIFAIILFFVSINNFYGMVHVIVAPRLYLLKQLKYLLVK